MKANTHTQTGTPARIALDVMGSDKGVSGIVAGGALAALDFGASAHITLVGQSTQIESALASLDQRPDNISVHHAEREITMDDSPSDAVRMPDTSVAAGLKLLKSGQVEAFMSPGNTGAVMAGSLLTLGRISGVNRPAICALFPTSGLRTRPVLDVGANTSCKPINLLQFAALGSAYVSAMEGIESPRVGLLSIGEERSKGNDLIVKSHELLEKSPLNFIGNVEGRDILSGDVDLVVTDGFTGNILLKFAESISPFLTSRIRHQVSTNIFSRIGAGLMSPFLRRLRRAFDYAESGGAPLLGIDGLVFICHGGSSPRAIKNALAIVKKMIENNVIGAMRKEMMNNTALHVDAERRMSGQTHEEETSLESSHG